MKGEDTTGQKKRKLIEERTRRDSRRMEKRILLLKIHNGIIRAVF